VSLLAAERGMSHLTSKAGTGSVASGGRDKQAGYYRPGDVAGSCLIIHLKVRGWDCVSKFKIETCQTCLQTWVDSTKQSTINEKDLWRISRVSLRAHAGPLS